MLRTNGHGNMPAAFVGPGPSEAALAAPTGL